jgi:hypothetical protein
LLGPDPLPVRGSAGTKKKKHRQAAISSTEGKSQICRRISQTVFLLMQYLAFFFIYVHLIFVGKIQKNVKVRLPQFYFKSHTAITVSELYFHSKLIYNKK